MWTLWHFFLSVKVVSFWTTSLKPIYKEKMITGTQGLPFWISSLPVDCINPIPLSATHWYSPVSSRVTPLIFSSFPTTTCRGEGGMGWALWSQVRLGIGFPWTSQVNWAVAPRGTVRSCRPAEIEACSENKTHKLNSSPPDVLFKLSLNSHKIFSPPITSRNQLVLFIHILPSAVVTKKKIRNVFNFH